MHLRQNSRGCETIGCMSNLYTWSNVVHKCVVDLKVDWIVYCVHNASLNACVSIKCATEMEWRVEFPQIQ